MAFDINRLRLMSLYGGSNQGDDGSMDYSPNTSSFAMPHDPMGAEPNSPNVDYGGLIPGQEPQNPDAADFFGKSTPFDQPQPQKSKPPATEDEWTKMYRDMYHPSSVAQDRLNKLLDSFPEDEKPTFARKFAASLAGVGKGGLKDAQFILDEPNRSNLERFKAQATPFTQAAENERQANVNERTLVQQTIAAKQHQQQLDEAERKNKENADIQRTRANAYSFAKEHPNWIINSKDGPNIIAYNPQDPTKKINLGPSNHLDDRTKLEIEDATKTKVANIMASATGARAGTPFTWKDPDGTEHTGYLNPVTNVATPAKTPSGQEIGAANKPGIAKGQPANIQDIQDKANETIGAINEIIDEKDQLRPEIKDVLGFNRYNPLVATNAPGFAYVNSNRTVNRVKNMLIIDLIGELKSQSRTGATGFGQLSKGELTVLDSAASKLDTSMDPESFLKEVIRIRDYVKKITQPATGLNPTTVKKVMSPQDLYNKYKEQD